MQLGEFSIHRGLMDDGPDAAVSFHGRIHSVRFSTSDSVIIKALGFYGPFRIWEKRLFDHSDSQKMKITLKIQESHLNRDHDFLFETVREELREFLPPTTVSVELGSEDGAGGKIFRVILPDPCPVPRGVILDVNFQFEEQESIRFYKLPDMHPRFQKIFNRQSGVEFTFYPSSKQLSSIYFNKMTDFYGIGAYNHDGSNTTVLRFVNGEQRNEPEVIETQESILGYRVDSFFDCVRESFERICTIL